MNYESTNEIECRLSTYFGIQGNIIVPNISWGLGLHECDLLILSKCGYATEIEIKISTQDLKQDALKRHQHVSKKLKYLYFAIPEKIKHSIEFIPVKAGILIINSIGKIIEFRKPIKNEHCRKFTIEERLKLLELAALRYWSLRINFNISTESYKTLLRLYENLKEAQTCKNYIETKMEDSPVNI